MTKIVSYFILSISLNSIIPLCHAQNSQSSTNSFAKGADVSWITQMEYSGKKFYSSDNIQTEGIALLKSLGMNSIRLRVWVNPTDGWCNAADLLVKAKRSNDLGMRIMIDFHYSDSWADPGKQNKPASWTSLSIADLKTAVANHTRDILNLLKANNITPEWVQVGNETGNGMLWDTGKASVSMANYAALNNAGYDAVKEVFPTSKVVVHLQNGYDNSLFRWIFDGLKNNSGKWDVIGMSLYPAWYKTVGDWQNANIDCLANMNDMVARYGKEVMIVECGMSWDNAVVCKNFLSDLITKTKSVNNNKGTGVFYWEPQCYGNWQGYSLGAFDNNGKPTVALDAFKDVTSTPVFGENKINYMVDYKRNTIIFSKPVSKIDIIGLNGKTSMIILNKNEISTIGLNPEINILKITEPDNQISFFKILL